MTIRRIAAVSLVAAGLGTAFAPTAHAQVAGLPPLPVPPGLVPPGLLPPIDPANPVVPSVPQVPVPNEAKPIMAIASPVTPTTCTAAFLVPLVGIVAIGTVFAESPVPPPVPPGALLPAFSALFTVCALTPFPAKRSCDLDDQMRAQVRAAPIPEAPPLPEEVASQLPVGVPQADVVSLLPSPVASVISSALAAQAAVETVSGPLPVDVAGGTSGYLVCR